MKTKQLLFLHIQLSEDATTNDHFLAEALSLGENGLQVGTRLHLAIPAEAYLKP